MEESEIFQLSQYEISGLKFEIIDKKARESAFKTSGLIVVDRDEVFLPDDYFDEENGLNLANVSCTLTANKRIEVPTNYVTGKEGEILVSCGISLGQLHKTVFNGVEFYI